MQRFPAVELIEASSEPALAQALARRVERVRPVESRLVRMHDCLWLRMWTRPQRGPLPRIASVQDLICSFARIETSRADLFLQTARHHDFENPADKTAK